MTVEQIEWLCPVTENRRLNRQFVILTFLAPEISRKAEPGQFVNVSCQAFLRRPFGIMNVDQGAGTIQIGIQIKGKGTSWLANLKVGEEVSLLGPLGHGFNLSGYRQIITVGGGTGVFPLYYVLKTAKDLGLKTFAVCGYRSEAEAILVEDFRRLSDQAVMASDAGDLDVTGHAGIALKTILDQLETDFANSESTFDRHSTAILTCGPKIMMQKVAELAAEHQIPCQVSLEEHMGCGVGICLVCVCKIKSEGSEAISHQRCCVEGPVFAAETVVW